MGLKTSIREFGDVTILDLRGRSTIEGESELLSGRLKKVIAKGARKLLLNLQDLTQIDTTGVSVIIENFVSLRKKGGELKLLNLTKKVHDLLQITKLYTVFDVKDDEASAVKSFNH